MPSVVHRAFGKGFAECRLSSRRREPCRHGVTCLCRVPTLGKGCRVPTRRHSAKVNHSANYIRTLGKGDTRQTRNSATWNTRHTCNPLPSANTRHSANPSGFAECSTQQRGKNAAQKSGFAPDIPSSQIQHKNHLNHINITQISITSHRCLII